MDVRSSLLNLNSLLLPETLRARGSEPSAFARQTNGEGNTQNNTSRDLVTLSEEGNENAQNPNLNRGSRLVAQEEEQTETGVRRIQEFQNTQGGSFTRVEEINNGEDRSTRTVIQQNESGSTTVLENVFDRQEDGSFRLTQRFTDGSGDTQTNIQFGVQPEDRDILLGRQGDPNQISNRLFNQPRGSELDLSA